MKAKISAFKDGALVLSCGKGMESDLVFASGAMAGDPLLKEQREILEFIVKAVEQMTRDTGFEDRPKDW